MRKVAIVLGCLLLSGCLGGSGDGGGSNQSCTLTISGVLVCPQGGASTTASAPGAPSIVSVTAGNAQVSVAFAAPSSNGGSAITSYVVTSSPGGITASGSSSPITVTGLTNGTAYTFTVTASNSAGTGAPSAASGSVTPSASGPTAPGAPTIGSATAGNGFATVAFTAPASSGGSTITSYTVTSSPGNIAASGTSSPIIVPGLTNGTAYTFTVKATNSVGTGAASSASNSVTPTYALVDIYQFQGGPTDEGSPYGSLTLSGNTLYGVAAGGGSYYGIVFSVSTDGANFTVLHTFNGTDGNLPEGRLVLSGGKLYGLTYRGGTYDFGTIYSMGTDGSNFTTLYSFANGTDGAYPFDSVILSGSTLYGMTYGSSNSGSIFSIGTDGSAFTVLHDFTGGADGGNPCGSLTLSGSTLYGMASAGGSSGVGVIFSVGTNGSGFTTLYNFTGGNDGGMPSGSLALSGSTLYGMTSQYGADFDGVVFSVGTNGSGFTTLHAFTGGSDGASPNGSLVLYGSALYGMTQDSDNGVGNGTIFSIGTNGSGFTVVYDFADGTTGGYPLGDLTIVSGTLYGMTSNGGLGYGTIFKY